MRQRQCSNDRIKWLILGRNSQEDVFSYSKLFSAAFSLLITDRAFIRLAWLIINDHMFSAVLIWSTAAALKRRALNHISHRCRQEGALLLPGLPDDLQPNIDLKFTSICLN
jgi:hypothetical protein